VSSVPEAPETGPVSVRPRGELEHVLLHHAPRGLPNSRIEFTDVQATQEDRRIAERVMRAFERAIDEQSVLNKLPQHDVWESVAGTFHGTFIDALTNDSVDALVHQLTNAYRETITHGLGPGKQVYEATLTEAGSASIATLSVDRLMALAEAVGVLPYENPEQGRWGVNLYLDPAIVLQRLSDTLGADLTPSQIMGYFGPRVGGGLFFARSADHLYCAWRCLGFGAKLTEIGAGLAGVGDYAMRLGASSYRIYDLPVLNALQGYALIRAGHTVSLLGEPEAAVSVRPWWHFDDAPPCDVVLNQDSFPEIDASFVTGYLRRISQIARYFVSINQEGAAPATADGSPQHIVGTLVSEVPGLRRRHRAPYWLRRGYVEEVYEAAASR